MLTLRLDGLLDERVTSLARSRGVTRSEVVRDALERQLRGEKREKELTAYDRMKPWIGIYDSSKRPDGPFDASKSKEGFAAYVEEKHRRRGARRAR